MSIKPEHIDIIATRAKNHEYRRYLLPLSGRRICLVLHHPPAPSRALNFNAGKKVSKYAYEILDLWRLKQPISLKLAISNGLLKGPPQKYCCVPLALLESCPMDTQEHIISRAPQETPVEGEMKDYVLPEESKEAPSS
ncbi:hypothetical protein RJZ90_006786 [Blastomyces dermatitidis]